jgi:peptide-methionine (S)-S-oxide reductase
VRERVEGGEGYFHRPYLLWFVAENPVRNDTLPANIVAVTAAIVAAAREHAVESFQEQIDYGLGLVCSGRVVRERGVQGPLIDLLVEAGADPTSALTTALAHRESEAVARLLERGASDDAVGGGLHRRRPGDRPPGAAADAPERQLAFTVRRCTDRRQRCEH